MLRQPSAHELLGAVIAFLEKGVADGGGARHAFLSRVAANALGIIDREMTQGAAAEAAEAERLSALLGGAKGDRDTLNRAFCEKLRAGELTLTSPGVMAHVRASALARVAIEQPGYGTYRAAREGRTMPWRV